MVIDSLVNYYDLLLDINGTNVNSYTHSVCVYIYLVIRIVSIGTLFIDVG